jgi:rSAM/selenodomain-associated transferase 1
MKSNAPPPELPGIAVFAKAPVPGEVKTRLAATLGEVGAARLHQRLVERALATALQARLGAVTLWCAPDESHPFFQERARIDAVALRRQEGVDLGERMHRAFEAAQGPLLLIGSDCPALVPRDLQSAAAALGNDDAVFIPAEDGGYVLVGLARPDARVFAEVPWGTARVMARTRERLAAAAISWRELGALWDVDRPEDYARLQGAGLLREAGP